MTNEELKEALAYYGIFDNTYESLLLATLAEVNGDASVAAAFETGRSRLFSDSAVALHHIWVYKTKEQLFGRAMPAFSTDLLLYSGCRRHREKMAHLGYDEEQIAIHKARLRQRADFYLNDKTEMPLIAVEFSTIYQNGKMTEVGRLQYEFYNIDGGLPTNEVHIHIPADGKLSIEAVDESLARAIPILKSLYKVDSLDIQCHSWLLSPDLASSVPEGSNLAHFRSLFNVTPAESCISEVYGYVFKTDVGVPYGELPEKTALQRAIKAYLLSGGNIRSGSGVLKV